ncbi:MAG: hypothetical protein M3548_05465, partial [Actinomycetota bacterium]|nr:hypothetical protein [Actinomycetota bacterium]
DPVFGYSSSNLADWVHEVSGGARRAVPVPGGRPEEVAVALRRAGRGDVVVPDVADDDELGAVLTGLTLARAAGARPVVRCAASFAAACAGTTGRVVNRIAVPAPGRVLVVCGSITEASTRQLRALGPLWTERVTLEGSTRDVAEAVRACLRGQGRALLVTPRQRSDVSAEALMDSLVDVVGEVVGEVDVVLAKGGITSARVARDSFGADAADVLGQPLPGVALWRLDTGHPYVVVPGNVGDDATLATLLGKLESR